MNDTSTQAIMYHRRPFLKKDAWMKAVLEKKTVFTQASLFKRGHWWYVTALGLLWCRGKIICYYLGPRYIKQNLGWYLPPFKTPQPPSGLFYYVGTLFQQPAKVINHCQAAAAAPAAPAMIHISIFLMDFFYIRRTVCIKLWLFAIVHRKDDFQFAQ